MDANVGVQRLFVGKVKDFRTVIGVLKTCTTPSMPPLLLSKLGGHKVVNGVITNIDSAGVISTFPTNFDRLRRTFNIE